jgi:hypothetical protein
MVFPPPPCLDRHNGLDPSPSRLFHLDRNNLQDRRCPPSTRLPRVSSSSPLQPLQIPRNRTPTNNPLPKKRNTTAWLKAYLPYLILFVTGYWTQLQLYWILGTFSTDVKESSRSGGSFRAFETAGQAISYGLNSGGIEPRIPFYINAGLLVLVVPFIVFLIRSMPEGSVEIEGGVADDEVVGSDGGGEIGREVDGDKR